VVGILVLIVILALVILISLFVYGFSGQNTEKDESLGSGTGAITSVHIPNTLDKSRVTKLSQLPTNNTHSGWSIDSKFEGKMLSNDGEWNKLRDTVFHRDGFKCVICGDSHNLSVDHIKERELGGTNDLNNLRTLCRDCHEGRHFNKFFDKPFDADDHYGEEYEPTEKVALINEAIENQTCLSIKYIDSYHVRSYRTIHPQKIYKGGRFKPGVIYFEAFDDLDHANRTFRLSRMRVSNNNKCEYLDKPVTHKSKWG